MSTRPRLEFLKTEAGAGLLLAAAALLAIAWANSPWAGAYHAFVDRGVPVRIGPFAEEMSVRLWVSTGLMPIFFFLLGLEMKREILRGELSNPRRLPLPLLAAAGGLAIPALIYLVFNIGDGGQLASWPAATATDTAVALAALAAAGPRIPPSLRTFLLSVALASQLAVVALVALLFTEDLRFPMLACAAVTTAVLVAMSRWRAAPYSFWAVGGLLLWAFTLKSGVDPSLAGVAVAFCLPLEPKRAGGRGVLDETLEALHPYVMFLVLPLFAFTAAGFSVALGGDVLGSAGWGVALALFLGKPAGVFGATALAIALKWARRPTGARWLELLAAAGLCGIGFTLSLYVGALAPAGADPASADQIRAGVMLGSLASAALGLALLALSGGRRSAET